MPFEMRKDIFADERDDDLNEVGKGHQRQDMVGHVTGRSPYFDDHLFDGLLHIKCVRSPHHHARIRSIDVSAASSMPGVVRILQGSDVPVNMNTLLSLLNFGKDDEQLLSTDVVRYIGEPVAAVIAESEAQAYAAVEKVRVEYEELPHILDVEAALAPGAHQVNPVYPGNLFEYHEKYDHQKLRFGDVEKGFREADHIIEHRYSMSPIEHAPVEPNGAIAAPETNDRIVCYTATQALFFSLGTTAKLLDMPSNRLHFVGGTVGGGFGGKVDSQTEPLAVLGCALTGKPVRFVFNRAEEMQAGPPRGAEVWHIKDGVMNDGRIVARQMSGYFDGGAYTRLTSYAVVKCVGHLPGPYTIPNVKCDAYCVFTNRTPATAMRGFGVTGADFSLEVHMDRGAEAVGMDPVEFRLLNAYRDGDMKAHRRLAGNCALIECAQVAAEKADWRIGSEYSRMSSLTGGGGERAIIPDTPLDAGGVSAGRGAPSASTPPLAAQSAMSAPSVPATSTVGLSNASSNTAAGSNRFSDYGANTGQGATPASRPNYSPPSESPSTASDPSSGVMAGSALSAESRYSSTRDSSSPATSSYSPSTSSDDSSADNEKKKPTSSRGRRVNRFSSVSGIRRR